MLHFLTSFPNLSTVVSVASNYPTGVQRIYIYTITNINSLVRTVTMDVTIYAFVCIDCVRMRFLILLGEPADQVL